jgi:hypothetical protein
MSRRAAAFAFGRFLRFQRFHFLTLIAANSRRRQPIDTGCAVISAAAALADSRQLSLMPHFLRLTPPLLRADYAA